jgi:hypothetical protein
MRRSLKKRARPSAAHGDSAGRTSARRRSVSTSARMSPEVTRLTSGPSASVQRGQQGEVVEEEG